MPNYKALGAYLKREADLTCEHGALRSECKICRIDKEITELKDYIKCYIENNEALQKENAELRKQLFELEEEMRRSEWSDD